MKAKIKQLPTPTPDGGTDFRVRCPQCREIVEYHCVAGGAPFVHLGCRS